MSVGGRIAKTPETKREGSVSQSRKPALSQSPNSPIDQILHLHRTIGNQAVGRLFKSGVIQAKLKIGQPNDVYEQEADRVAEQVMRMPENTALSGQLSGVRSEDGHIQRKCAECASGKGLCPECAEEEEMVQRKPLTSQITSLIHRQEVERPEDEEEETLQTKEVTGVAPAISTSAEARINNMRGNGQPFT